MAVGSWYERADQCERGYKLVWGVSLPFRVSGHFGNASVTVFISKRWSVWCSPMPVPLTVGDLTQCDCQSMLTVSSEQVKLVGTSLTVELWIARTSGSAGGVAAGEVSGVYLRLGRIRRPVFSHGSVALVDWFVSSKLQVHHLEIGRKCADPQVCCAESNEMTHIQTSSPMGSMPQHYGQWKLGWS